MPDAETGGTQRSEVEEPEKTGKHWKWQCPGGSPGTMPNGLRKWLFSKTKIPCSKACVSFSFIEHIYMNGLSGLRKKTIKDLGISPSTCSFNPGDCCQHDRMEAPADHKQLEKWMQKNVGMCGPLSFFPCSGTTLFH